VVRGAKNVADVVDQRTDHIFLIAAVPERAGGGLQAVLHAVDREAAAVAFQQPQMP
jgi:hypothetical protein